MTAYNTSKKQQSCSGRQMRQRPERSVVGQRSAERRIRRGSRRGAALLLCLFVVAMTSLLVVRMLDSQTTAMSAHRNTLEYDQALHLAGAGVHHALAELENDFSWRGTVSEGTFPNDESYTATAVDGAGGEVVITGKGAQGEVVRTLEVTVLYDN